MNHKGGVKMARKKTMVEQEGWKLEAGREDQSMEALEQWTEVGLVTQLEVQDAKGSHVYNLAPEQLGGRSEEGPPGMLALRVIGPAIEDVMCVQMGQVQPGGVRVDVVDNGSWAVFVDDQPVLLLMNKQSGIPAGTGPWPHAAVLLPDNLDDYARMPGVSRLHIVGAPSNPNLDPVSRIGGLQGLALYRSNDLGDFQGLAGATIRGLKLVECYGDQDLSVLERLPALASLHIVHSCRRYVREAFPETPPVDARLLARIRYLRTLSLRDVEIEYPDRLGRMAELETLDLFHCRFDQEALHFPAPFRLHSLCLAPCKLSDLEVVSKLKRLKSLELLWAENLQNLDGIENLVNLEELTLSGDSSLPTLAPLGDLQRLTKLEVSANGIYSACGIERLKRLTHLDLGVPLSTTTELQQLTGLKELSLHDARIRDLSFLTREVRLDKLVISSADKLENLKGLDTQDGLKELHFFIVDRVSDYSELSGLAQLEALHLAACKGLTSLSFLRSMPNVAKLTLDNCPALTSIQPMEGLTKLRQLTLRGCPQVSDLSPLSGCQALEDCIIELEPLSSTYTEMPSSKGPSMESLGRCPQLRSLQAIEREAEVASVLAQSATLGRDWRFIRDHGDHWLEVMMLSDQPAAIAKVLLSAFLGARKNGVDAGHLDRLVGRLSAWSEAHELVRNYLESEARWQAQNGDK